jgi:hypothetical protein
VGRGEFSRDLGVERIDESFRRHAREPIGPTSVRDP